MDNQAAQEIFTKDYNVKQIISNIGLLTDISVTPEDTLIVLDEIQECDRALNCLKYFCENAPEYHIIAVGSLLGIAVRTKKLSFPVGKVAIQQLEPLNFLEFLSALGYDQYRCIIENKSYESTNLISDKLTSLLKEYFFVGGMPEAVLSFAMQKDFQKVRTIQQDILDGYTQDFSKYAEPKDVLRILAIWKSLPALISAPAAWHPIGKNIIRPMLYELPWQNTKKIMACIIYLCTVSMVLSATNKTSIYITVFESIPKCVH